MLTGPLFGDLRFQAAEFGAMICKEVAVAGEVGLFEGGGLEGGFGVEEAGKLRD